MPLPRKTTFGAPKDCGLGHCAHKRREGAPTAHGLLDVASLLGEALERSPSQEMWVKQLRQAKGRAERSTPEHELSWRLKGQQGSRGNEELAGISLTRQKEARSSSIAGASCAPQSNSKRPFPLLCLTAQSSPLLSHAALSWAELPAFLQSETRERFRHWTWLAAVLVCLAGGKHNQAQGSTRSSCSIRGNVRCSAGAFCACFCCHDVHVSLHLLLAPARPLIKKVISLPLINKVCRSSYLAFLGDAFGIPHKTKLWGVEFSN